jgi:hypothetical protein
MSTGSHCVCARVYIITGILERDTYDLLAPLARAHMFLHYTLNVCLYLHSRAHAPSESTSLHLICFSLGCLGALSAPCARTRATGISQCKSVTKIIFGKGILFTRFVEVEVVKDQSTENVILFEILHCCGLCKRTQKWSLFYSLHWFTYMDQNIYSIY